jgi:hypothetical protein
MQRAAAKTISFANVLCSSLPSSATKDTLQALYRASGPSPVPAAKVAVVLRNALSTPAAVSGTFAEITRTCDVPRAAWLELHRSLLKNPPLTLSADELHSRIDELIYHTHGLAGDDETLSAAVAVVLELALLSLEDHVRCSAFQHGLRNAKRSPLIAGRLLGSLARIAPVERAGELTPLVEMAATSFLAPLETKDLRSVLLLVTARPDLDQVVMQWWRWLQHTPASLDHVVVSYMLVVLSRNHKLQRASELLQLLVSLDADPLVEAQVAFFACSASVIIVTSPTPSNW